MRIIGLAITMALALVAGSACAATIQDEFNRVIDESRRTDVSVTPAQALLYHGLGLVEEEEFAEAIPFLEEAISRDPALEAGWEGLGWCYVRTGQQKRARDLWFRMRDLMPEKAKPHALVAQYEILEKEWVKADESFRKALAINTRDYDLKYAFAQNLMRLGETEEAEAVLKGLVKENPDRVDIQHTYAQMLANRFQDEEALKIYHDIAEVISDSANIKLEQATLELRVGELEKADRLCREILELEPENMSAMRLRADIAEMSGQEDVTPLEALVEATTNRLMRSEYLTRLAGRCVAINRVNPERYKTDTIIDRLQEAVKADPLNMQARQLLAELCYQSDRLSMCRSQIEDVLLKYNHQNVRALSLLFEVEVKERNFAAAQRVLRERFRHFDRDDPMIHYYRARLYSAQGEYAKALEEAKRLEEAGSKSSVLTLKYTGLTESDWMPQTSVRRLTEHIRSLQRAGWDLVSADEIPRIIGAERRPAKNAKQLGRRKLRHLVDEEAEEEAPLPARFFDHVGWMLTGLHYLKKDQKKGKDGERRRSGQGEDDDAGDEDEEDWDDEDALGPQLTFAVTFDTARRSQVVLGTRVAEEFGVPFALFTPSEEPEAFEPSRLEWDEIRQYARTGNWIVGSSLLSGDKKAPVDKEGNDMRDPLHNRLWRADRNRVESMNEWDRRIRREFRDSRAKIRKEMGSNDCAVAMVAYPHGSVGQVGACNISTKRSISDSIISEAASSYRLGFVQSSTGFTLTGDDPMIARRYEPSWADEGEDVVRHAYEFHPYFLGRRMRAELAMLLNQPNEANKIVAGLRKDGYPEDLCTKLDYNIRHRFRNRVSASMRPLLETVSGGTSAHDAERDDRNDATIRRNDPGEDGGTRQVAGDLRETEQEWQMAKDKEKPWFDPAHPYGQVDISHTKANDQVEIVRYGGKAGANLNEWIGLYGEYHMGEIKQTVRPYWNARTMTDVVYDETQYRFKADTEDWRAGMNWRLDSGVYLFGSGGLSTRKPDYSGTYRYLGYANLQDHRNSGYFTPMRKNDEVVFSFGARWNPEDNFSVMTLYDHDYVASAVKDVTYDSLALMAEWLPFDHWKLSGRTQYWTYRDDNAMYFMNLESLWSSESMPTVWYGLRFNTTTTSDPSDFYWTPYWDKRALGVLRYETDSDKVRFRVDIFGGFAKNDGRGGFALDDKNVAEEIAKARAAAEASESGEGASSIPTSSFRPVYDLNTDWKAVWGFGGLYSYDITDWMTVSLEFDIMAMRSYIDHMVLLYLLCHF